MFRNVTLGIIFILLFGCTKNNSALKGKVLHIPLKDNVKTADPTNSDDVVSAEVISEVYEGPYQYNYFKSGEVIPNLAKSMPEISKDGKTYVIHLKKGILFQNDPCFKETGGKGREVKAQDFIYGWKRHANPANESQAFWIWDGKIVGINDFQKKFSSGKPAAEVMNEEIEGMKALDDYTIQIKLTRPYPELIHIMTMLFTAPIAKEALDYYGKDFVTHPVGTGAFRAVVWEPTSKIQFVHNENFREEYFPDVSKLDKKYADLAQYSGKRLPLADGLEFTIVKEEQPRWLGFLSGKFDEIEIPKDNYSDAIQNVTEITPELKAKGISVSIEPAYLLWYVSMNQRDKTFSSNKYLRQAIASAINQKEWLHKFKNDRGSPQTEMTPTGISERCGKPYRWTYDVARAKKLMEKAGYPNGEGLPVFKFDTRLPEQSERQLAEFLQKNLAEIGVKVEINVNTFPAYLDKMNKGVLQISKSAWAMDYPDAENTMQLLYGPNKSPGPNDSNFDNPEYNKLYQEMAEMHPNAKRTAIICKMEEIIQEEAPVGYGIYENMYRLVNKRAKSYHTAEMVWNKLKWVGVEE